MKTSNGRCLLQHSEISHGGAIVNMLKGWCHFYISLFEPSIFFSHGNLVDEANIVLTLK